MQGLDYWIQTFLSRPAEAVTLLAALLAFGIAALRFTDSRDTSAVVLGSLLLVVGLPLLGPSLIGEWHYWLGGTALAAYAILVVDSRR